MSETRKTLLEIVGLTLAGAVLVAAMIYNNSSLAHADARCAAACNSAFAQCLSKTHDRGTCDGQRNQCLKGCGAGY